MTRESSQQSLDKERIPFFFEVHIGDAIELKTLPGVLGILADLSGEPAEPLPDFESEDRKFVEICDENFDAVLKRMAPRLMIPIDEPLDDPRGEESPRSVELIFRGIEDFRPERIVNNLPYLKALLEERQHLSDLLTTATSKRGVAKQLGRIGTSKELLQQIIQETTPDHIQEETPKEEVANA